MIEKSIRQILLVNKRDKITDNVKYRNQPSLEVLYEIAKILDVNPKELFIS